MKITMFLWLIALNVVMSTGCNKPGNDDCVSYEYAPVVSVTGPVLAAVNQAVNLNVQYTLANGCGQSGVFEEVTVQNTTTIKVKAKYVGCMCTQALVAKQMPYNFIATQPGTYLLRFLQY